MAEAENLVLENLRRIRADIATLGEKIDTVISRTGRVEQAVAGLHADFAEQSVRIDRMDKRLERIEQRLVLVEA